MLGGDEAENDDDDLGENEVFALRGMDEPSDIDDEYDEEEELDSPDVLDHALALPNVFSLLLLTLLSYRARRAVREASGSI